MYVCVMSVCMHMFGVYMCVYVIRSHRMSLKSLGPSRQSGKGRSQRPSLDRPASTDLNICSSFKVETSIKEQVNQLHCVLLSN